MAKSMPCRRTTDLVGGDTACQSSGPTDAQAIPSALVESPVDVGAALLAAGREGAVAASRPLLDVLLFGDVWAVDFEFGAEFGRESRTRVRGCLGIT